MKQAYLQSRLKSKKLPESQNSPEMFSVIRLNTPCKRTCVEREEIQRVLAAPGAFPMPP